HAGHMAQIGLNMGQRDARLLGWAKSFTKKLDAPTMILHDEEIIGAVSLIWGLIKAVSLEEVIAQVEEQLEADGFPRIATRNVAEGTGFKVELGGKIYEFPYAERAPPKTYMSVGYVAYVSYMFESYCD
ncbi:hypothetical protein PLICRDRAFT_107512, partial [Plicaturopsis crispa FD-325 SS-3]